METEPEIEKLARMVQNGFAEMHQEFAAVHKKIDSVEKRLDKRIDLLDQKVDRVDAKLDQHRQETKDGFAAAHRFIGGISTTLADHEERIKELEGE
jgi:hypothetical protein